MLLRRLWKNRGDKIIGFYRIDLQQGDKYEEEESKQRRSRNVEILRRQSVNYQ